MSKDKGPMSRSLHYKHLEGLKRWLTENEYEYRAGARTGYSVLDVRHDGHWMGVYSRGSSDQHLRIDRRLYPVIKRFMRQRRHQQ